MTEALALTTAEARRLWQDFQRRLDWANRDLDAADRADIRAEAATHIRDAVMQMNEGEEVTRLRAAINSFGMLPAAPPAWRRPAAIALHYGSILALGVAGVFILILLHMAVMEVFYPDAVGLWRFPDGDWALSYEAQDSADEVLGGWFIPVIVSACALASGLLYALWRFAVSPDGVMSGWMRN